MPGFKPDFRGCIYLGEAPVDKNNRRPPSLCSSCGRPVGECDWLMDVRPYKGMHYYSFYPPCENAEYYIIKACPWYIETAPEKRPKGGRPRGTGINIPTSPKKRRDGACKRAEGHMGSI